MTARTKIFDHRAAGVTDPIDAEAMGSQAVMRFGANPDCHLIPVVRNGRPVGILTREETLLKFAQQFGRDVWAKRPVSAFMTTEFRVMPESMPAEELGASIAQMSPRALMEGAIFVDDDGFYSGAASAFDLYRAAVSIAAEKNAALTDSARLLARETEKANAASQSKSNFLATMSHEIRTPLNGVLGMAQSLLAADLGPAEREKVGVILESGRSLLLLLNDVLDLAKIEAGRLEISRVKGDISQTLNSACDLFRAKAEEKGIALELMLADDLPTELDFDALRIRQCVGNLLSNAIKFTNVGRVAVRASCAMGGAGDHIITIAVTDTGIGMNAEVQSRLFHAFSQGDSSTTRIHGGTGLGLAISRQLARLMGGDITARSVGGRGSTFALTFTARAPSAVSPDVKPAQTERQGEPAFTDLRVLLTDDNAINRQVIKLFLAPLGCRIVEAQNGQEALDKLGGQDFDVVLMDVHMPVMDGKEAVRRIRASAAAWRDLPVIALTADAMAGDRERLLALGMTGYLAKPVDQRELSTLIASVVRASRDDRRFVQSLHASGN